MELSNEKPYHNRTRRRVVCRRNDCERTERDANHEAPSNINKSNSSGKPSGSEASSAAAGHSARVSGAGKFCRPKAANRLDYRYASMTACQKHNKSNGLHCV
jgi:hypothetical protein